MKDTLKNILLFLALLAGGIALAHFIYYVITHFHRW